MTFETVRDVLAWCIVINFVWLIGWFLLFRFAHEWIYGWHRRWFNLSKEAFDTLHYGGMALFKMGVILFNLAPYLAMRIVG